MKTRRQWCALALQAGVIACAVMLAGCAPLKRLSITGAEFGDPPVNPAAGHTEVALRQQHDPVENAGRLANATYCDAIEAVGYTTIHAVHQLFCQEQVEVGEVVDAPSACPVAPPIECPTVDDSDDELAKAQSDLQEAVVDRDKALQEVNRYANLEQAAKDVTSAIRAGCEYQSTKDDYEKPGHMYICQASAHELLKAE